MIRSTIQSLMRRAGLRQCKRPFVAARLIRCDRLRLEDRTVPALVAWTGDADDGLWSTAKNWDTNAVPTSNDDGMIDVPGEQTVTINSGDITVRSVTSFKNLTINGTGNLKVTNDWSVIEGELNIGNNRTLRAEGSTTYFLAYGLTKIDGASVYASAKSKFYLPGVTSYDGLDAIVIGAGKGRGQNSQARMASITWPCTSVSRRSMPLWRTVSFSWSMPIRCRIVACRS